MTTEGQKDKQHLQTLHIKLKMEYIYTSSAYFFTLCGSTCTTSKCSVVNITTFLNLEISLYRGKNTRVYVKENNVTIPTINCPF